MKASFPDGMEYLIALDTNDFVRLSIKESSRRCSRPSSSSYWSCTFFAELPHDDHLQRGDRDCTDRTPSPA